MLLQYFQNLVTHNENPKQLKREETLSLYTILIILSKFHFIQASPNLTDLQYKRSALHFAVLSDNIAISRLLLHSGADPSLTDVFGYTALHFCQSKEMLGLLQEVCSTYL